MKSILLKTASWIRWISPDDGEFVITVKATDDTDEAVVSDPVTIRIAPLNPNNTAH
jgi:hypothetical protein